MAFVEKKLLRAVTQCPFLRKTPSSIVRSAPATVVIELAKKCPVMHSALERTAPTERSQNKASHDVAELSKEFTKRCPMFPTVLSRSLSSPTTVTTTNINDETTNGIVDSENSVKEIDACTRLDAALAECECHVSETTGDESLDTLLMGGSSPQERRQCTSDVRKTEAVLSKPSQQRKDEKSPFDYESFFSDKIVEKKQSHSYRVFKNVNRHASQYPLAETPLFQDPLPDIDDIGKGLYRDIDVWCSNDYLGMSRHPVVMDAVVKALKHYGAGSGGTRNISGNSNLHLLLEREVASLHRKEAGLIFQSCYVANETTLSTLLKLMPGAIVFSDEENHASMIQGMRHSCAEKRIFRHNDVKHLEQMLRSADPSRPKMVAIESLYSMSGTVAPIGDICTIARRYNAITFMDEAHAVGLYGEQGAGKAAEQGVMGDVDIISATFGKTFGVVGGYVVGSSNLVDTVRSYGSGFIFTTSVPPIVTAAALASVRYLRQNDSERLLQNKNSMLLKSMLKAAAVPVKNSPTHIIPIFMGCSQLATRVSDDLFNNHNIYAQAINYPTVPRGQEILRVVPSPHHTMQDMERFVNVLYKVWKLHSASSNAHAVNSFEAIVHESNAYRSVSVSA